MVEWFNQTNGMVKWFNQTIHHALLKLVKKEQDDWDQYIDSAFLWLQNGCTEVHQEVTFQGNVSLVRYDYNCMDLGFVFL